MAVAQLNPAALPLVSPDGIEVADLETAEQYLDNVRLEISDIETQLAERNRCHPDGSRMTAAEYWEWRSKAVRALHHKRRWATRLKGYVRSQRSQRHDARDLLQRAYPYLRAASDRDADVAELGDLVQSVRELLGKTEGF